MRRRGLLRGLERTGTGLAAGLLARGQEEGCHGLESLVILRSEDDSDLVRVDPGRPAAHPSATGWDEELRNGPPVYDYRCRGTPSHHLGRIHSYVRSYSAAGTNRERSDWRT